MSFLGGKKSNAITPTALNGIDVSTSKYGQPVPLVYGKQRVSINLLDYLDFVASAQTQNEGKGGGGKTVTGYNYSATWMGMVCEGPIGGVGTVWNDKDITTLSALGLNLFGGSGGQGPWPYLTTNHPDRALGYDHTAYVAVSKDPLGSSAALPNVTLEVLGFNRFSAGVIDGGNPAAILTDYLTDPNHGAGWSYLDPTVVGTSNCWGAYCVANQIFLNCYEDTQRSAQDFVKELMQITNSDCWWSNGLLKVKPYADEAITGTATGTTSYSYTPDLTPLYAFGDDDYLQNQQGAISTDDPVVLERKSVAQTYNIVRVEFNDASNAYNSAVAQWMDENDVRLNGPRPMANQSFKSITDKQTALQVATLIGQRQLYIRNTYTFSVRMDYSLLEPMDLVAITDTNLGVTNKLVRIIEIGDDQDDIFTITAEEMFVGTASAPRYDLEGNQGYQANYAVLPPNVQVPVIFDIPANLTASGDYEVCIAVGPGTPVGAQTTSYGGCDVYASADGGITYSFVGTMMGSSRFGMMNVVMSAGTSDPDTANTAVLSMNGAGLDGLELGSATSDDFANLRSLVWVDGEIMAYQTATLVSFGSYNVTTLHRGLYGTPNEAHAANVQWARLDDLVFRLPIDPGLAGKTLNFKFCSFNSLGRQRQDLSAVTAYPHLVTLGQQPADIELVPRGGAVVVGSRVFKGTSTLAWDADVSSTITYTGSAVLIFQVPQTDKSTMLGLTRSTYPTSSVGDYSKIDYAVYLNGGGTWVIYEGTNTGIAGSYVTDDYFEVQYDGHNVRYLHNGNVIRSISVADGQTLRVYGCFYDPNVALMNINFTPKGPITPVQFIARANCQVSDSYAGKISGTAGWDSDIYSLVAYNTCNVVFKSNIPSDYFMIGFSRAIPGTVGDYTSIEYAIECAAGTIAIYQSGSLVATYGGYTEKTRFAITYDGATVRYWADNVELTNSSISSAAFYCVGCFYSVGAAANSLDWGPGFAIPLIDTSGLNDDAATQTVSYYFGFPFGGGAHPGVTAGGTFTGTVTTTQDFAATSIVTEGGVVGIDLVIGNCLFQASGSTLSSWSIDTVLLCDGAVIATSPDFQLTDQDAVLNGLGQSNLPVTLTCMHAPAAGSHTYQIRQIGRATNSSSGLSSVSTSCTQISLKVREYKK